MDKVEPVHLVILVGAGQGLLISVSLLVGKAKSLRQARFFGWALLMLSLRLLLFPFAFISQSEAWKNINKFSLLTLLLVGPLLFFFLRSRQVADYRMRLYESLHFAPFIYYLLHLFGVKLPVLGCYGTAPPIMASFYGLLGLAFLFREQTKTPRKSMTPMYLALFLIPLPMILISRVNMPSFWPNIEEATLSYLLLTAILYRMGFSLMRNPKAYLDRLLGRTKNTVPIDQAKLDEVKIFMESEKVFLDPQLSLQSLSERSGLTRYEITTLLNQGMGQTFHEFINGYRVREVQERLKDPQYNHLSIVGIANESGFKSKSTFNDYFKVLTGMTPREYKQKHRED